MRNEVSFPNKSEPRLTIASLEQGEMFRYKSSMAVYMKGPKESIFALITGTIYDNPSQGDIERVPEVTILAKVCK